MTAPECPLTPRELEILRLADHDTPVVGHSGNYLAVVVTKLGIASRAEAIHSAHDNGWQ